MHKEKGNDDLFRILVLIAEVLILILFPLIFGAGIKDISLIWAPWSFLAGILIMAADVLIIGIKLIVVKVNEGRAKTG